MLHRAKEPTRVKLLGAKAQNRPPRTLKQIKPSTQLLRLFVSSLVNHNKQQRKKETLCEHIENEASLRVCVALLVCRV
jgi:hypothetical protein